MSGHVLLVNNGDVYEWPCWCSPAASYYLVDY